MIDKEIYSINESDLQALVDNEIGEKKSIEYKGLINLSTDSEKKEFLADVSSFANSAGGDLIVGICETKAVGRQFVLSGFEQDNLDGYLSSIENIIRDGIKPRIIGITIQPISLLNGKHALIIRIPNSWNSPHRVVFKSHDKFYARNSNGKYSMDVDELRVSFTLSESINRSINDFVEERVNKLYSGKTPFPVTSNSKIILHLVPISAFKFGSILDIKKMEQFKIELRPLLSGGWNHQFTIDGYLAFSREDSYSLLFRNGIIEAVTTDILKTRIDKNLIPSSLFEKMIFEGFQDYLKIFSKLEIVTPIFAFITLVGIKDYSLATADGMVWGRPIPHGKEILSLSSGKIDKLILNHFEISQILRPIFDSLWNAYGYKESPNFLPDGNWIIK
jgi:hypothetical protein